MTSLIVEELFKRMIAKEEELNKVIEDYIKKGVFNIDGTTKVLRHIQVISIVDHIERIRREMIQYNNQWREFKRIEEEK
jgi:hypothetical protein